MDTLLPIDISSSALSTQRLRLGIIASNLANMQTTQTPEGGPYQRKSLRVEATSTEAFKRVLALEEMGISPKHLGDSSMFVGHLRGVRPVEVVNDNREPLKVYDPDHPDADETGYVLMPNISAVEEMTNMIAVQRAYEANVAVIKTTKGMVDQALSIAQR